MKTLRFLFFVMIILGMTDLSNAQKVQIVSGFVPSLVSEQIINMEFRYDNMVMGKDPSEAIYIKRKVEEYEKKYPGKGEIWTDEWNSNKVGKYEPALTIHLNKVLRKTNLLFKKKASESHYTFIFHTTFMETGWTAASSILVGSLTHGNAKIDLEISIVETQSPDKVLAKLSIEHISNYVDDMSTTGGDRIASAYSEAGTILGKYILKTALK